METEAESAKRLQRKQKKAKRKAKEAGLDEPSQEQSLSVTDQIIKMTAVKMSGKLHAFDCFLENANELKVSDA